MVQKDMSFKDISFLELWQPIRSADQNHLCNFGRRYYEEQFVKLFWIWTSASEECHLNVFSYLDIWQPFCLAECNHICNLGRGYYEKQFCEIILNLGQLFRCCLKDFLSVALVALLLGGAEPFMPFRKRASCGTFMWSNMKFGPVVREMFKDISYQELWQPLCSVNWNHLCNIERMHHEEQSCEIIMNLDLWFRRKCHLKEFLIWSSVSPSVQPSVTVCAFLVEGIKRNNSVYVSDSDVV